MSSFTHPHHLYLFSLKNGRKKLAYGKNPRDALDILRIRLSESEMSEIMPDEYRKIRYLELVKVIDEIG